MDNYRKHPKKKHSSASLDGFVSNTGSLDPQSDVQLKRRFSTHYQPQKEDTFTQRRNLGRIASHQQEGFHARGSNIESDFNGNDSDLDSDALPDLSLSDDVYRAPGFLGHKRTKKHKDKKDRKERHVRRTLMKGFAVFMVALIVAVGSLFAYGYLKTRQIFRGNGEGAAALDKNVDPSRLNGEGDGRINILLLGKGGAGHTAPDLTDTLLLASIDPVANEAALLSVPRDMYVEDENGYSTKINAVYSNAKQAAISDGANADQAEDTGLRAIEKSITEVIGVPIHYYVMVDFKAFEDAINIVGGVTVDVKKPLYDYTMAWLNGGNPLLADQGLQTFDGQHALYFARSRYGSSDFDRSERQRQIIIALQQKVIGSGTFSNPFKVVDLLNTFSENVRTDLNGEGEIKRLYEIGQGISGDRIISVGLTDDPVLVTTDFIDNQSIVRPVAGLYQYEDIQTYVRNTLKDAFLKQENSRVVIMNGTGVGGLATSRKKELESYGYNIVTVDNAPTADYENTRLIQINGDHRYTASYLARRLGVNAEEVTIDGLPTIETADFVIILGNDEVTKASTN